MHAKTFLDYFLLFIPYTVLDMIIVEKFLTILNNFYNDCIFIHSSKSAADRHVIDRFLNMKIL